ncbi:NADH dehydrogenase [ubiquinone] 1 alpha subcomplex assembly factor 4-like [Artemia franciscana]|uniref:Uncharacterized protein n=1 Tax=Artemia franciscana TaxID=6661 RepID=A0AA88HVI1_ARTSF|nr:hypothetical protein QYM36_009802 [Artemia franciscana]
MGIVATKAKNTVTKTLSTEYRIAKAVSQDKPTIAPKHPSSVEALEKLKAESEDAFKEDTKKDAKVSEMAKNILISTEEMKTSPSSHKQDHDTRPRDTKRYDEPEFGYTIPEKVSPGKLSIKQLLVLLSERSSDPKQWTEENLSNKYNIHPNDIRNLVQHFATMQVIIPENVKGKYSQQLIAENKSSGRTKELPS